MAQQSNLEPSDSLKTLYLMTFGVMRLRLVKAILIIIFIFHSTIGVIQIIELLVTFDGNQLLQYGPFFLVSCSCLVTISSVFTAEKILTKLFIKLAVVRFWTLTRFPPEISKKIAFESKIVTGASIIALTVMFLFSTVNVPFFGDKNVIYGIMLIQKSFGRTAKLFCFLYYGTLPILAYVAFISGGVLIYTLMHLRFYIFVINHYLERIVLQYDLVISDSHKLRDEEYQKSIYDQLKICIGRHQFFKKIEKKLNAKLLPYLLLLLYLGTAAVLSMLFNILVDASKFGYFVAIGGMVVSVIVPLLLVHVGQCLKDEYEKMFANTLKFPWIVWNSRNRKILFIFILNLQKSLCIGQPGLVLCEYSFIPSVLSFVWTFSTFIVQVASKSR
ncbi:odorant receptor 269 [Tribolium castaneum]|uniref:Odorant receptor n=1 Tax=Tribolium castaneum TaxID=7070 RepID=D6WLQ4_TRICA|nr:odorant receptor 269 [Tribolium castaneum]